MFEVLEMFTSRFMMQPSGADQFTNWEDAYDKRYNHFSWFLLVLFQHPSLSFLMFPNLISSHATWHIITECGYVVSLGKFARFPRSSFSFSSSVDLKRHPCALAAAIRIVIIIMSIIIHESIVHLHFHTSIFVTFSRDLEWKAPKVRRRNLNKLV